MCTYFHVSRLHVVQTFQRCDTGFIELGISFVITLMGPPDKKKSPKKWRKYLDKQNARRAAERKVKKHKAFQIRAAPYVREAIRRAKIAFHQAHGEKVARVNAYMLQNDVLQQWPELLMSRLVMRTEELWLVRKEIERNRKEFREMKARGQTEIGGLRMQLRTLRRKLHQNSW